MVCGDCVNGVGEVHHPLCLASIRQNIKVHLHIKSDDNQSIILALIYLHHNPPPQFTNNTVSREQSTAPVLSLWCQSLGMTLLGRGF